MPGRSLFMVWSTKKATTEFLGFNRGAFPEHAEVDWIDLQKWLDLYTRDLVNAGALVMIDPDPSMKGVAVSLQDLARDIKSTMLPDQLQGSDISRIKNSLG